MSTKLIFWALPEYYEDCILTKLSAPPAGKLLENTVNKAFFEPFLEHFDKKLRFFGVRSPS